MLKRFMKSGSAPLKLAGLLAIGTAVHAAIPYLPLVGPSPLRFEVIRHPEANATEPVATSIALTKTNARIAVVSPISSKTNEMVEAVAPVFATSNPSNQFSAGISTPIVSQSGDFNSTLVDGFSPSVFALPTPDLLGITPQTLAGYFHPVHFDTNVAIVGPFPLTFVPPVPSDKSSHAEYIIK